MMVPIFILSVLAIYLFFERLMIINKANQNPDQFMNRVKELVVRGDINGAKMMCAQTDSPVARMIQKGLSRIGSPLKNIEASTDCLCGTGLLKSCGQRDYRFGRTSF